MKRNSSGFTLVEIAIVLVIIGFLLGGVLKGQALIRGARVHSLISTQDSIRMAFDAFQDRFRAYPGDYASASKTINCSPACDNGNGNGRIEPGASKDEALLAWSHLSASGFLAGTPKNPYGADLQLAFNSNWGVTTNTITQHNLKTGNQVPVDVVAEADRKVDDGKPLSGRFQFSVYAAAGTAPTATDCVSGTTWNLAGDSANCGAATLF